MPRSSLDPAKAVQGDVDPFETVNMALKIDGDVKADVLVAGDDIVQQHNTTIKVALPILKTNWGRLGVALGILATLTALCSFFALDLPEMLSKAARPFSPARENEILVIVTDFTGDPNIDAPTRIYRALYDRADAGGLEGVRVERLEGKAPRVSAEARSIGQEYGATLVIWGTADAVGIDARYEIVRNAENLQMLNHTPLGVVAVDLPTYSAYITDGAPREFEYLMLFSVGAIAAANSDNERAIAAFSEALNIPLGDHAQALNQSAVYFYRGASYYNLGDTESALADYSAVIDSYPADDPYVPLALNQRYVLNLWTTGDNAAAVADLTRLIDEYGEAASNPELYYHRGLAYRNLADSASALNDFSAYLSLNSEESPLPSTADVIHMRGLSYWDMGEYDPAYADFSAAVEMNPANYEALYYRATIYETWGDTPSAIADYTTAIDLINALEAPDDNQAYIRDDCRTHIVNLGGEVP